MITIAGSGPSTELLEHVDVATKKRSVPSDYVFCRFGFSYDRFGDRDTPLMVYYSRLPGNIEADYICDSDRWDKYYKQFTTRKRPPQKTKPSTGLCAVFGVIERWNPQTIGLIGYDYILDGHPAWEHDADAERRCIQSLVEIKDLRND